jgi:UDP:flavonoid glycosyltransferase YjiC (YdhE family)
MTRFLAYVAPGSGHTYPLVATLLELRGRGHEVVARADGAGVELLRDLGIDARRVRSAVEQREDDTWMARTPFGGMRRSVEMYLDRFEGEAADVCDAIGTEHPDVVLVDNNCWGAAAAAEASSLPWAQMATYLLPLATPDAPPFGLGLRPARGPLGHLRDAILRGLALPLFDRFLPRVNSLRMAFGAGEVAHLPDLYLLAPLVVSFSAPPIEYARPSLPESVHLVGPTEWEPNGGQPPAWLDDVDGPLVLVSSSTQFQDDAKLIETALEAVANEPYQVVVTTGALDPDRFDPPANVRLERLLPHRLLLPRCVCAVSHGGLGGTQKALLNGVPVCLVPFGRDQFETARRVEVTGAGTSLPSFLLGARRLRRAMRNAIDCKPAAERVGQALRAAGGERAAADALERLDD